MFQINAKIVRNEEIRGESWHCVLEVPFNAKPITRTAKPGQFINVRINNTLEPFLRRPFSIHKVEDGRIWIMYEILGKGTKLLSARRPGEKLDIIGPLGNGFDFSPAIVNRHQAILVAGGMGVAPLIFLAERIKKCQSVKVSKCQSTVLIGAKTRNDILCEKEFKRLDCQVKIATNDGSRGFKGKVTGLLKDLLLSTIPACRTGRDYRLSTIYACGPKPMLREIAFISKQHNIPAQVSLEEHMACGIGACLGCAVNTTQGFKRVCKEGPVLNADEIIW